MTVTNFYNYGTMNEVEAGATQINHYYGKQEDAAIPASAYTDEAVGRAIMALNGEKKPLCEKQLFLAIIKVLAAKCGLEQQMGHQLRAHQRTGCGCPL